MSLSKFLKSPKFKYLAAVFGLVFGLGLAGAGSASADAQFCNYKGQTIALAARYVVGQPGNYYWVNSGWTALRPGECTSVTSGDASKFYFYFSMIFINSANELSFVRINEQAYYYCVAAQDFSYYGTPTSCGSGFVAAPFYRWSSSNYNASFSIRD